VSYWALSDGQGALFGPSIWIEYVFFFVLKSYIAADLFPSITVVELNNRSDDSSEGSLASSSIVMPQSASVKSSVPAEVETPDTTARSTPMSLSPITAPSKPASENGSDSDTMSLISIPSSEDEDEDEEWEDSRVNAVNAATETVRSAMEYVVLYDDSSSDED
jgi:next-to-BRCA1 protein 1